MGVHECVHGMRAYKLHLVMGQHIDIIAIGETDIIARSRVEYLRVAVLVTSANGSLIARC